MATYKLRFFFDNLVGVCVWSGNPETFERFDYPIDLNMLPLPGALIDAGNAIIKRWERHVYENQPWPTGDSLATFARNCGDLVAQLRAALPDDFEVCDEHTDMLLNAAEIERITI